MAAFHAVYKLLNERKKIYSTENNGITVDYKMLLCRGLVLLTEVNFQPRFNLVPLAGLNAFCTYGSRVHAELQYCN